LSGEEHDDSTAVVIDGQPVVHAKDIERGHLRMVVVGSDTLATHALARGDITIGRRKGCEVQLDHESVSRFHAVLRVSNTLTIEDLGSVNGTFVRGKRLAANQPTSIEIGEQFSIGKLNVVVQNRPQGLRLRRVWAHDYFEARLEEESARGARGGSTFVVLRVHAGAGVVDAALEPVLGELLRDSDVLGKYGPGTYEVLLADTPATHAEDAVARIERQLAERGFEARFLAACFPRDGQSANQLLAHVALPREQTTRTSEVIVGDDRMRKLHALVEQVATSGINVLLLGETGVGKEVFARKLHASSARAGGPFVELNCAALSDTLLESELFGHEKGAFTNASAAKPGLIETANGGTLFLDEVGDMPLTTQVKFLRVIEEHALRRVGGVKARPVDVRFVAATNIDLDARMAAGTFRSDLYFRLAGMTITIPPLRERLAELEALIRAFVRRAQRPGPAIELTPEALDQLRAYSWPGNVRELKNVIEHAIVLSNGGPIQLEHLPREKLRATVVHNRVALGTRAPVRRGSAEELQRITEALEQTAGNQTHAAQLLGISRRTLVNRLNEHEQVYRPRKDRTKQT
jgi:DNA-binding NtrC family response regulator